MKYSPAFSSAGAQITWDVSTPWRAMSWAMRRPRALSGRRETHAVRRPRRASAVATLDSVPPIATSSAGAASRAMPSGVESRTMVSPQVMTS